MRRFFNIFLNFIKENKLLSISFLIVFVFFMLQHSWALGWDFAAYVINARYFFGRGDYAEVLRAPLTSFLLLGEVFFGKVGEYFYLALASILFFIANFKLASLLYIRFFYRYKI